jgi:dihydroxy-acid dehydratase
VFDSIEDFHARVDDPDLDVTPDSVLILRGCGPMGYPGMPEVANLPLPQKILKQGVRDMVRISDGRMSGTAYGTVVLHVSPESAANGPLRAVQNGDMISLDVDGQRLDLEVPAEEIQQRLDALGDAAPRYRRGYGALYLERVLQADEGCDFDFLRAVPGDEPGTEPYGLLSGWVGGW